MQQTPPFDPHHEPLPEQPKPAPVYEDADPYAADHRDYMLQQSRVNLLAVSQMSDLKANLILTLSAVTLQFALSKAVSNDATNPHITYWVIAVGSLITIILCGYSTMPKAAMKRRELEANTPLPQGFNLLYFGSYTQLPLSEYKKRMNQVLRTPPLTHDAILDELHQHGRFIMRHKYLPLRLAYASFLLTLVTSALLYALF
ncbi:MAG: hypothetical protein JNM31_07655 [Flavobacteriales bacterium]|nr:hypothetical protein [Flavobacteriales bacterium]